MKPQRLAPAALAALFTFAACAENPVAPDQNAILAPNSPLFARGTQHPYTFTQLDVTDASGNVVAYQTQPSGISAGGEIVGWYSQGTGCSTGTAPCTTRGFILKDGVYTPVVYHDPVTGVDAPFTQLRGVGPGGDVAGTYRMAGEPAVNIHGFILTTSGEFIRVGHPQHTNTVAQRILPTGTILGCYHDADQMASMHGMITSRAGVAAISTPASMQNGGTPDGRRGAGFFTDMTGTHGYVFEAGELSAFDAPQSIATQAWDMSPRGTIVGLFADDVAPNATHGFVLEGGQYTTINFSATSTYTDVFGTNASGDIVGKFRLPGSSAFHGYVATRKND